MELRKDSASMKGNRKQQQEMYSRIPEVRVKALFLNKESSLSLALSIINLFTTNISRFVIIDSLMCYHKCWMCSDMSLEREREDREEPLRLWPHSLLCCCFVVVVVFGWCLIIECGWRERKSEGRKKNKLDSGWPLSQGQNVIFMLPFNKERECVKLILSWC